MTSQPAYLIVARIVAPFGVRGELKAEVLTDFPDRLAKRTTVYLGDEKSEPRAYTLRGLRFHKGQALLSLDGCPDRTAAESLRGLLVQIPAAEAPAAPPGRYYYHQIVGLQVWDAGGQRHGAITAVLATASNDVYVVEGERGELLLPALPGFVLSIDLAAGRLIADLSRL